jgi:hypothetical protein
MKRLRVVLTVVVILAFVLGMGTTVSADPPTKPWSKATGGAQAMAGGVMFSQTVSAKGGVEGAKGQMQYSREEQMGTPALWAHARVACLNVAEDVSWAVATGPAFAQYDPSGQVEIGDWMLVEIMEGGTGSGDMLRVRFVSMTYALGVCQSGPSGSYPGMVYDGNFTLRP